MGRGRIQVFGPVLPQIAAMTATNRRCGLVEILFNLGRPEEPEHVTSRRSRQSEVNRIGITVQPPAALNVLPQASTNSHVGQTAIRWDLTDQVARQ